MILREAPEDWVAISRLTTAAFRDAAHSAGNEAQIVERLREDGDLALSLVAVDGERPIGHIAFSPVTIDGADAGWFGLGPVSVIPAHQGRGVGGALIREGLARLAVEGAQGCVVLGDPPYYARFGFEHDPNLRYPDAPPEYFLRTILTGNSAPCGDVAYPPAFSDGLRD